VAQIRRAMAAGARQFVITGFVPDPRAFMRRWAREVAGVV
jgi:predicted secreted protein